MANEILVIPAPANVEFVDMGYDVDSDEVGIVGYVVGADKTATLFEVNENQDGFDTQVLADLPGATGKAQVAGISSDASRIAGVSKSPGSTSIGEGATWLRTAANSPTGVGFLSGFAKTSVMGGAWKDGVVGDCGGGGAACKWSTSMPLTALAGGAEAKDVSSDGSIMIGFSSHEVFNGAAYYWDSSGIHRLADTVAGFTLYQSIAYAVSPNGNNIGGYVAVEDNLVGVVRVLAAVWEGSDRTLRILKDKNGIDLEGVVFDISDLGYAVGTLVEEDLTDRGFIWHSSFGANVKVFEDWLSEKQVNYSPKILSRGLNSLSEDRVHGKFRFTLLSQAGYGYVEVDAPEIIDVPNSPFAFQSLPQTLAEGSQIQITVTASPSGVDRELTLSASADSRLNLPSSLTFPANAAEASFTLAASDDQLLQGDITINLRVESTGFLPLSGDLSLADDEALVPFTNPFGNLDVNNDGFISPLDALVVINYLNLHGASPVSWDGVTQPTTYWDSNGDRSITPIDVLLVINRINIQSVGESEMVSPSLPPLAVEKDNYWERVDSAWADDLFSDSVYSDLWLTDEYCAVAK